jgi:hypothetical protein
MLTAYWLNDWSLKLVAAACDVLLRAAGIDCAVPRSNEDFVLY